MAMLRTGAVEEFLFGLRDNGIVAGETKHEAAC